MTLKVYSKSFKDILKIKESFIIENKKNLKEYLKIVKHYKNGPKRTKCKNCKKNISESSILFISFEIKFYLCKNCNHINGEFEDDKKFTSWLYKADNGKNYGKTYLSDYKKRVENIYVPKVNFLKKVIKNKITLMDVGAGAGHFLKALEINKIQASGIEPNKALVGIGNTRLKKNKLALSSMNDIYKIIKNNKKHNVLSLLGVLEHLEDPNKLISTFYKSKFKYLYLMLPLFSISSFFENNYTNVFPRVLGGPHTHCYSKKSLQYMFKKHNLKTVGSWWFGSDMFDLYRMIMVSGKNTNKNYQKDFNSKFGKMIDDLQQVVDRHEECNEVHLILKKTKADI